MTITIGLSINMKNKEYTEQYISPCKYTLKISVDDNNELATINKKGKEQNFTPVLPTRHWDSSPREENRPATAGSNPSPVRHRAGSRDSASLFLLFVLRNREPVTSIPRSGWIASRTRRRSQPPTDKTTTFQPATTATFLSAPGTVSARTVTMCCQPKNRISFLCCVVAR